MKKEKILLSAAGIALLLTGCGIFPKEEELKRTPIIQAYQQEEFKMAEVKKGDLQLHETIEPVCMNVGESKYQFQISNLPYAGINVKLGDKVTVGTVLAELSNPQNSNDVADNSQLSLKATEDGRVVFLLDIEDGEMSIAGQTVVITNKNNAFYLNAYTKYWNSFNIGDTFPMRIQGMDCTVTVVDGTEVGMEASSKPQNSEDGMTVYFKVEDENVYLKGGDTGSITILVDERKDVLYVPESAITLINGEEIVYVENEDGIRSVQKVETGLHADNKVEILSGLQEGDKVILE